METRLSALPAAVCVVARRSHAHMLFFRSRTSAAGLHESEWH